LLDLGIQPGPEMGIILKQAFEAQLDGEFADPEGGLTWLRERIQRTPQSS